jgi:hypothetical protein
MKIIRSARMLVSYDCSLITWHPADMRDKRQIEKLYGKEMYSIMLYGITLRAYLAGDEDKGVDLGEEK